MSNRICSSSFSFSIFSICSNSYPKVTNKSLFTHTMVLKKLKSISQHYFNVLRKDYLRCIKINIMVKALTRVFRDLISPVCLAHLSAKFFCSLVYQQKRMGKYQRILKSYTEKTIFYIQWVSTICTQMKDIPCSVYLDKLKN